MRLFLYTVINYYRLVPKHWCECRRNFSAHDVSDSRSAGNDHIDGSGSPPLSRDKLRREACRICARSACYARIVPNDVSPGEVTKLVCADNRRRVVPYDARDARATACHAYVEPGRDSLESRLVARRDSTYR